MLQLQLLHCLPTYLDVIEDTSTDLLVSKCILHNLVVIKFFTQLLCVGSQGMISSAMVEQSVLDHQE